MISPSCCTFYCLSLFLYFPPFFSQGGWYNRSGGGGCNANDLTSKSFTAEQLFSSPHYTTLSFRRDDFIRTLALDFFSNFYVNEVISASWSRFCPCGTQILQFPPLFIAVPDIRTFLFSKSLCVKLWFAFFLIFVTKRGHLDSLPFLYLAVYYLYFLHFFWKKEYQIGHRCPQCAPPDHFFLI